MKKFISLVDKTLEVASRWGVYLSGGLAYMVSVGILIDILLRLIVGQTFVGLFEVISLLAAFLYFYGLPRVTLLGSHLYLDIVIRRFSGKTLAAVQMILDLLMAVLFIWVGTYAGIQIYQYITKPSYFGRAIQVPYSYHWIVLTIVLLLTALVGIRRFSKSLAQLVGTRGERTEETGKTLGAN